MESLRANTFQTPSTVNHSKGKILKILFLKGTPILLLFVSIRYKNLDKSAPTGVKTETVPQGS